MCDPPRFRLPGAAAHAALVALFAATPLLAQSPPTQKDKLTKTPFARFVPAATKLFVEFRRPGDADEALRQAQAWQLWSAAAGGDTSKKPIDLRTALTDFLGPGWTVDVGELMNTEIGLLSASWSDLSSAIWLVRLPQPSSLDRWFPKDRRQDTAGPGAYGFFRMTDGMVVGVRDGIVAMARRSDASALLRQLFRLMVGGDGESLENLPGYRELVGYLPGRALAVVYWVAGAAESDGGGVLPKLCPPLERAVAGISTVDGRIDFAVRGVLSTPRPRRVVAPHAIDRLMKLPATTLAAFATMIDLSQASQAAAAREQASDLWARALVFLTNLGSAGPDPTQPIARLGPHVIVAWDQDLGGGGSVPQLALLVEATDARGLNARFEVMIDSLVREEAKTDSTRSAAPAATITRTTHLGIPVGEASLNQPSEGFPFPLPHWIGSLNLSWAAHGEWFIVALGREHLERILDAQLGLVPTLATVRDVQALRKRQVSQTSLLLVQPDLASDVLQRWVIAGQTSSPTKLDPSLLGDPTLAEAIHGGRLGIGMQVEQEPGTVVVARVYPDTAADGRLLPDDRIIGVDGRLLDLASPNTDLRRRWTEPSPSGGHVFRVQRDDTTIDVVLKRDDPEARPRDPLMPSLPAIGDLVSSLRTIRFASLTVHPTDERHFSALLSLRVAPPPSASTGR